MNKLTKPRFVLVYLLVGAVFCLARTSEPRMRLGIALVVLGEMLRCWANGYVGHRKVNQTEQRDQAKIGRLITAGPYAFVRHPLYLGSGLIGLGCYVIVGNIWFAVAASLLLLLVYRRKIVEEEDTLRHEWREEFDQYRRAVPRWLPSWRRYRRRTGRWSWQGIAASKEWKTVVWVTVFLILLYFREEVIQEHEPLFKAHGLMRAALLGLLVLLVLGDGVAELARYRSKRLASARERA